MLVSSSVFCFRNQSISFPFWLGIFSKTSLPVLGTSDASKIQEFPDPLVVSVSEIDTRTVVLDDHLERKITARCLNAIVSDTADAIVHVVTLSPQSQAPLQILGVLRPSVCPCQLSKAEDFSAKLPNNLSGDFAFDPGHTARQATVIVRVLLQASILSVVRERPNAIVRPLRGRHSKVSAD